MSEQRIETLILPGLGGSGPDHWQSRWQKRYGYARVDQATWDAPSRIDWLTVLDERVLRATAPVVLVAHSLACSLIAHWSASASRLPLAALLVAPADIDALAPTLPQVASFAPVPMRRLPFATTVVASDDDPYVSSDRAAHFARNWGSELVTVGAAGHINADSSLGDWPHGHALLEALIERAQLTR